MRFRLKSVSSLGVLALLAASPGAFAQANNAPDRYGDRQQGRFGDISEGYYGNPGVGHFTERRFPRDQEGRIAPSPAVPLRQRVTTPPPYIQLNRPVTEDEAPSGKKP